MMNILLTGGSGFIGRNILEQFQGRHVVFPPGHHDLDLSDQQAVDVWFSSHDIDVVIHGAIKPGHRNAKDFSDLLDMDLRMFFNLLKNVEERPWIRMFNIGSGSCYDMRHYAPLMKESYFGAHIPVDATGFAKYVISNGCIRSKNVYDLRVFGIFGKYEDYAIRFISNAICKNLMRLPITIKQDRMFHYLWIDDFIRILEDLFTVPISSPAINVTPDDTISLLALGQFVNELSGKDQLPILVSTLGMGIEYSGDNSILRSIQPGLAFTPIRDSVEKLYTWYARNIHLIDRQVLLVDK